MKIKKSKYFRVLITVLLLISVPVSVLAVKNGILPSSASGGFFSATVNRMDISLDKTCFELQKTKDGAETFLVTAVLSVNKCEPDLFGHIISADISGINCNYVLFTADAANGSDYKPEDLYLRDTAPLKWKIELSFNASTKQTLSPELQLRYASGLTADTADEYLLSVPLTLNIK